METFISVLIRALAEGSAAAVKAWEPMFASQGELPSPEHVLTMNRLRRRLLALVRWQTKSKACSALYAAFVAGHVPPSSLRTTSFFSP